MPFITLFIFRLQILPIALFPEPEINQASHRLVNEHANIPNSRILMQVIYSVNLRHIVNNILLLLNV